MSMNVLLDRRACGASQRSAGKVAAAALSILAAAVLATTVTATFAATFAAGATAKPGTVQTKSGLTYNGDIRETAQAIVVTTNGVQTTIAREDVASVVYDERFEDEFKIQWSKLEARDLKGRVALAKSAIANRRLDLAATVLAEATRLNPDDEQVLAAQEQLSRDTRIAAEREASRASVRSSTPVVPPTSEPSERAAPEPMPVAQAPSAPTSRPDSAGPPERRYLSPADIQVIRQNELRTGESARVQIPSDVRRSFAAKSGMTFADFNAKSSTDQAVAIIQSGDNQLRKQIKVVSDPKALVDFKVIQRPILSGCASMQCHGGFGGGGLVLFSPADNESATYTNFYILTKYSKTLTQAPNGIFGGPSSVGLIERGHGEQSLLVQYGLSPLKAEMRHPPVANYNGIFRDKADPRVKQIIDWMDVTLRASPVDPEYKDIAYKIIVGKGSSNSSTAPSTAPSVVPTPSR